MPGQTIGVSVFTTRLMESLGLSSMQLSVTYMLGTFLSALLLSWGGRQFDVFGARRALFRSTVALGCVLIGMSYLESMAAVLSRLTRSDPSQWWPAFLVLSLGFALLRFTGQGMLMLSSRAMMGKWFDRRRGTVSACSGAVVSFAFSGAPMSFEFLIQQLGWQWAWRSMGLFFIGVLAIVMWVFARDNPEECGLQMDGDYVGKLKKANPDAVIYRDYTLAEARRTFSFWAFALMFGLQGLAVTAYAFHVIAISAELGVSSKYILGLFMPIAVVSVVSGFVIAWLTDLPTVRIKYLLCVMALASLVGFAALAGGDYPDCSWLQILGFGISGGCFGGLSSIVWPRFFGREHLGAISGLFMTVIVLASAVGPFLFSAAEHFTGSYRVGFIFVAILAAVIAIASLRADNPQRRAGD
jgi:MFS family permease